MSSKDMEDRRITAGLASRWNYVTPVYVRSVAMMNDLVAAQDY